MTAETIDGNSIYTTRRVYMPQAGDSLGKQMVLGPDKKLGFLRDTSIQPFAPKEEHIEMDIPDGIQNAIVKVSLSYELRPGDVYPLFTETYKVSIDK